MEQDHLPPLSVQLVTRFHTARRRCAGAVFDSLYADWLAEGDIALNRFAHAPVASVGSPGTLLTHELPFTYTQFGKQPGVAQMGPMRQGTGGPGFGPGFGPGAAPRAK